VKWNKILLSEQSYLLANSPREASVITPRPEDACPTMRRTLHFIRTQAVLAWEFGFWHVSWDVVHHVNLGANIGGAIFKNYTAPEFSACICIRCLSRHSH
jgi:hypothetical protein